MSSLFDKMPGMNNVRNAAVGAVNSVNKLTPGGGIGNVIIYVLLILIVILIYLLLTGYKFSLKMLDIRPKKYKALDNAQVYWKSGMGGVNNLRITEDEGLPHDLNSKYTYHIDILLTNTRNISNIEGPYRHIFHRGSSELYNDESLTAYQSASIPVYFWTLTPTILSYLLIQNQRAVMFIVNRVAFLIFPLISLYVSP